MDIIERDLLCGEWSDPEGLDTTCDCEDLLRGGEVRGLRSLLGDGEADRDDDELEHSEPDDEHNDGRDATELDIEL